MTDSEILLSETPTKKGIIYHRVLASGVTSGIELTTEIYTIPIKNDLYALTLVLNTKDYNKIRGVTDKIMESFELK